MRFTAMTSNLFPSLLGGTWIMGLVWFLCEVDMHAQWAQQLRPNPNAILKTRRDASGRQHHVREYGQVLGNTLRFQELGSDLLVSGVNKTIRYRITDALPHKTYQHPPLNTEQTALAISLDKSVMVTGYEDGSLRFWDLETGFIFLTLAPHEGPISAIALGADGHTFATADETGSVRLWNLSDTRPFIAFEEHEGRVLSLAFSKEVSFLLSAGEDGFVREWNLDTTERSLLLGVPKDRLLTTSYSRDETQIIAGYRRNPILRFYDRESGEIQRETSNRQHALRTEFSENRRFAITTSLSEGWLTIQDLESTASERTSEMYYGGPVKISNQGDLFFRGAGKLWIDLVGLGEPAQFLHRLPAHSNRITGLSFTPDGSRFISSGFNDTTRVTDLLTGKIQVSTGGRFTEYSFDPSGRFVFGSTNNDGNWGYDLGSGEFAFQDRTSLVSSIGPNRHLLIYATQDNRVWIQDRTANRDLPFLEKIKFDRQNSVPAGSAPRFLISPDQSSVLSETENEFKLWNIDTGRLIKRTEAPEGHTDWRLFSDNRHLGALFSDGRAAVFDLDGENTPFWLNGETPDVASLAISGDGRLIALGHHSGRIEVRDWPTDATNKRFLGHDNSVTALAFSPDGQQLLSGDADGLTRLWENGDSADVPRNLTLGLNEALRLATRIDEASQETVQWLKNDLEFLPRLGASNSGRQLQIDGVSLEDVGIYRVQFGEREPFGTTESLALTVVLPPEEISSYQRWGDQFPWNGNSDAPEADPDRDAVSNLGEYHAGTHPLNSKDYQNILSIELAGDNLRLKLHMAAYAAESEIVIQSSDDLSVWQVAPLEFTVHSQEDGSQVREANLATATAAQFYRWSNTTNLETRSLDLSLD